MLLGTFEIGGKKLSLFITDSSVIIRNDLHQENMTKLVHLRVFFPLHPLQRKVENITIKTKPIQLHDAIER